MKKFLFILLLFALILAGTGLAGYAYYNSVGEKPLNTNEEIIEINVEPNDNFGRVLTRLDNNGLLRNLLLTRVYFRFNPMETALRPG
ncbi:hypothetical protein, partial [Proteiniclasticum ruminis]